MKYKIFRIEEQMYGCEEPPADQPILVDVVLEGADGTLSGYLLLSLCVFAFLRGELLYLCNQPMFGSAAKLF